MHPRFRRILISLLLLGALLLLAWRVKRALVPAGAPVLAFLFDSTPSRSATGPDGSTVFYRFRESLPEGESHHQTWCYTRSALGGKTLLATGYSLPSVRSGEEPFPWHWHGEEGDFSVRFTIDAHNPAIRWVSGQVR